jgi:hypothetical protein
MQIPARRKRIRPTRRIRRSEQNHGSWGREETWKRGKEQMKRKIRKNKMLCDVPRPTWCKPVNGAVRVRSCALFADGHNQNSSEHCRFHYAAQRLCRGTTHVNASCRTLPRHHTEPVMVFPVTRKQSLQFFRFENNVLFSIIRVKIFKLCV